MTHHRLVPLLLAALLGLSQCKDHDPDPSPADQLPPATQTGANTFGCLVNGQPWLPSGFIGTSSNYRVTYDPSYSGGSLQIRAFRLIDNLPEANYIFLDGSQIDKVGNYPIGSTGSAGVSYVTGLRSGPCQSYKPSNNISGFYMTGRLTITRLDMSKGIISGTFAFTLAQPGCDTLKVTQGRFDKQL